MPTPEARATRDSERSERDHDLLISVASDVRNLIEQIRQLEETMKTFKHDLPCNARYAECSEKLSNKVNWSQFWSIIILLTALLGGAIGYNFKEDKVAHDIALQNQVVANRNQNIVDRLHDKLTEQGRQLKEMDK